MPGIISESDVKVQIYLTTLRKVQDQNYRVVPGSDIAIRLIDKNGAQLANGLYYVTVTTSHKKSVLKLLILR